MNKKLIFIKLGLIVLCVMTLLILLPKEIKAADSDSDGVSDACDNCPAVPNSDQADNDIVTPVFFDNFDTLGPNWTAVNDVTVSGSWARLVGKNYWEPWNGCPSACNAKLYTNTPWESITTRFLVETKIKLTHEKPYRVRIGPTTATDKPPYYQTTGFDYGFFRKTGNTEDLGPSTEIFWNGWTGIVVHENVEYILKWILTPPNSFVWQIWEGPTKLFEGITTSQRPTSEIQYMTYLGDEDDTSNFNVDYIKVEKTDSKGNACDNCWGVFNPDQTDTDGDCLAPPYDLDPACGDVCDAGENIPEFTIITAIIAAVAGFGIYLLIRGKNSRKNKKTA
jgi:hypothetical protein